MEDAKLTDQEVFQIQAIANDLRRSQSVLVITGAGMSADSGLPTYRGIGGLYQDAGTEEGLPIEVALSGEMLRARPEIPWRHIAQIERACRGAKINRGHQVLAEMEHVFGRFWILTQNVDGLHQAAGSRHVMDIHGDIHTLACLQCDYHAQVADYSALTRIPPACPECRGLLRPRVVLFGERLPEAPLQRLHQELRQGFDMVFSIGTSSVFPYIYSPVLQAVQQGLPTVEINPQTTQLSEQVGRHLSMGAAQALEAIWSAYRTR